MQYYFDDIDVYLPQLIYFYCGLYYDLLNFMLKPLSKLRNLKYVIIDYSSFNSDPTDDEICEIINNCPEITSICFSINPYITHKTIDALISLAEKKPFCYFVHSFGPKPDGSEEDFDYLEFISNQKYESLPKNLNIIPLTFDTLNEWQNLFKL